MCVCVCVKGVNEGVRGGKGMGVKTETHGQMQQHHGACLVSGLPQKMLD